MDWKECLFDIIGIFACVCICFCGIMSLVYLFNYFKNKYSSHNNVDSGVTGRYIDYDYKKIRDTFLDIIAEEFDIYSRYHMDIFQPGTSYLKPEEIKEINTIIVAKVYKRITPTLRNNLLLIYNFKNDEELINIIQEQVGIIVVNMAVSINNSMIEDTHLNLE